jgi:adenylate cyclase
MSEMKKRRSFSWTELSRELKRRHVYTVVATYAVVSWVLLQIGEVTFGPLHLPEWVMSRLVVLVIIGFPIVVVLAWFFDLTRKGIRLTPKLTLYSGEEGNDRPSIAVLPFADMSPERDQGYFCEGVAEEILNALSNLPQLRVAARSPSFEYRESHGDVRRVGRELGVKSVLEGSVRKSNNRLRITAQLVAVSHGYHLWSKSFDKELKDIFLIQDEIAKSIAETLLESITPLQQSALKTTSTSDVTAYDYYLRGRQFISRLHKTEIGFARRMFRKALELDPGFALAWAGYADCFSLLILYEDPIASYREEARKASQRALELDPNLAEAHASRGLAFLISEEFEAAETEFNKALALNPRLFQAYYYYGRTRFHQGDLEMAADLFWKAAEVEPADYQSRCLRIQILRGSGRMEQAVIEAREAVRVLEKHLEWNPDDARALHLGAGSLIVLGDKERAKRWLKRALEMNPDDSVLLYNVACNFATLGEVEESIGFLTRATEHGTVSAAWMRNDTDLAPLREDARFQALLKQLEGKGAATGA